ncbi:MAG: anhydro-N-acetylmuramic acid kinase [Bacteroidota bacterium]|nr:anhydro-N-acetylmuramic acid kinase [Bacteroidota bacterium]
MSEIKNKQKIVGVMSGTSLDGLDLALCEFETIKDKYNYKIIKAITIPYTEVWRARLTDVKDATAEQYFMLNGLYGSFIAEQINAFIGDNKQDIAAIASHGHTVFHRPSLGFTTQMGCGATIAAKTGITTVCDFRSVDVALGGQGAPLVPMGDELLFGAYDACLNLGGIANISYKNKEGKRIAYDICEANMLLNYLSEKIGHVYDEGGRMARAGKVEDALLEQLNKISFYKQSGAKSIGREWFEKTVIPFFEENKDDVKDLLSTSVEHISDIIAIELNKNNLKNVLITGGGAFNSYLIEKLKQKTICELVIPDNETVNFKEALIFAFLGYLRLNNQINTLKSVTGASRDSVGGAVYISNI